MASSQPATETDLVVHVVWTAGALLCLQTRAQDFVRVGGRGGADFGEEGCREDAEPMVLVVGFGGVFAHGEAGEALFEVLVERELDGNVGEAEQSWRET